MKPLNTESSTNENATMVAHVVTWFGAVTDRSTPKNFWWIGSPGMSPHAATPTTRPVLGFVHSASYRSDDVGTYL